MEKNIWERNIDREEFIYIIFKSFFHKNEKNDTSSKIPYNFPRKHTEFENSSQNIFPQNTVFLGIY